jgi:hypothetical protein
MLGQKTSYKALGCCGLIIGGFFLGIDQENALGKNHLNTVFSLEGMDIIELLLVNTFCFFATFLL